MKDIKFSMLKDPKMSLGPLWEVFNISSLDLYRGKTISLSQDLIENLLSTYRFHREIKAIELHNMLVNEVFIILGGKKDTPEEAVAVWNVRH